MSSCIHLHTIDRLVFFMNDENVFIYPGVEGLIGFSYAFRKT